MPVHPCTSKGKRGYKYGNRGKCYVGKGARRKAERQAAAIRASGYTENASYEPKSLRRKMARTMGKGRRKKSGGKSSASVAISYGVK